ncbi:hypothetical protein Q4Q54_14490 [Shewanella sp. SP2S2-4]|uniref:restriction endonuclease n=1 Tax=Shewanella sp. SP2S2-4 TaxID=3063539 RepID=UPI0028900FFC|nr:restriction endonuclease [Shewanella sp. SP2S2-4]MDT3274682.1 hypothetical protein [Shewanella sp. SP2S2-4]
MAETTWQTYEEVATYLLNQFASEFELDGFSGKEKLSGMISGTKWEIDGKGFNDGRDKFVIVECRRYTTSKQSQEKMAALAYQIHDTGAAGGIIVSPLGMQAGAEKIAKAENIISVKLTPESTAHEYFLAFLNKIHVGVVERLTVTISVSHLEIKNVVVDE